MPPKKGRGGKGKGKGRGGGQSAAGRPKPPSSEQAKEDKGRGKATELAGDDGASAQDPPQQTQHDPREHLGPNAAFHVIVLGPAGGPREDRVTSLLVRSIATEWAPGSMVSVDAGTLLSAMIDLLPNCERNGDKLTSGPFKGLRVPHQSPEANAAHIFRNIIGKILLTHPHIDHIAGLAINTPAVQNHGPIRVAALESSVTALTTHIFNDVIWPNLTNENGGVGLMTLQRLEEAGSGDTSEEKDYIDACEGLLTKCFGISHGKCIGDPPKPALESQDTAGSSGQDEISRPIVESSVFFLRDKATDREILVFGDIEPDTISNNPRNRRVWQAAAPRFVSGTLRAIFIECSYSESVQDLKLYGHLCPRHLAEELDVLGKLVTEAKRSTSPSTKRKHGDGPGSNEGSSSGTSSKTRKSDSQGGSKEESSEDKDGTSKDEHKSSKGKDGSSKEDSSSSSQSAETKSNREVHNVATKTKDLPAADKPLTGLSVFVIHVKDDLTDGADPRGTILGELNDLEKTKGLGCDFHVTERGSSIYV